MHLLPLSLGRLAEHADRKGFGRFATEGIHLRFPGGNTFEAVATDTRVLARVCGPCAADPAAFPPGPEFDTAPDGEVVAVVPADVWKRVFGYARKLTRRTTNPAVRSVAVRMGTSGTTFGVSDGDNSYTDAAENVEGRYPPYEEVLRTVPRGSGRDRVEVDARLLAELLRTAGEFSGEGVDLWRVEVETFGPSRPVVVRSGRPGGVEFVGLVMPMAPVGPPAEPAPAGASDAARAVALDRLLVELVAERDALARRVAELEAALAAARPASPGSDAVT